MILLLFPLFHIILRDFIFIIQTLVVIFKVILHISMVLPSMKVDYVLTRELEPHIFCIGCHPLIDLSNEFLPMF